MKSLGVRYGCLNFEYVWYRTPGFSISNECSFLEQLIIYPGRMSRFFPVDSYENYLKVNSEEITFALGVPGLDSSACDVPIIPYEHWLTYLNSNQPFIKNAFKKLSEDGIHTHGSDIVDWSFLSTVNSGAWMRGSAGVMSDFRNNKLFIRFGAYATSLTRRLIQEGYDLNLLKVKKGDWKEIAKVNCIAWKKYQDFKEGEWLTK